MKPENNKERIYSIIKFSVLFTFTVFLIEVSFFFDFNKVPLKENKVLREQALRIEKETQFQKRFSSKMTEIKSLLDSLNVPGQNIQYIDGIISSRIAELQEIIPREDSTYRYHLYKNIVQSYLDLRDTKLTLKSFDDVDEKVKELESQVNTLTQELESARRTIDAYRIR